MRDGGHVGIDAVIVDGGVSLEGARAFLGELSGRGIPLVTAGEPGDYARLRARLGTPVATTWVIASEPRRIDAACGVGFPTVLVLDEGDEARQDALAGRCDILVHDLRELSLALIEDYVPHVAEGQLRGVLRALVVNGSPEPSSPGLVRALAGEADYVIAADRGAEALHGAGIVPDVFCGDADSVSPEVATWARQRASADILYPKEKYESDLALALSCARHEADRMRRHLQVTLTCTSGGRPDHALTVMGSLVKAVSAGPRVVEDGFECRLLAPGMRDAWSIEKAVGRTFSVVALREGTVISEHGSKWELDHREVDFLGGWGLTLSNEATADPCVITCHEGLAAVFLVR